MAIEFGGMNQDSSLSPSLARYQFYDIQKRREELEEERKSRYQTVARGASDLWKMYTSEQAIKSKELLSFDERLEMDPEYLKKGFLGRSFTPAGGRIRPKEGFGINLEPEELRELEELQGREKFSQYFTDPLKYGKKKFGEMFRSADVLAQDPDKMAKSQGGPPLEWKGTYDEWLKTQAIGSVKGTETGRSAADVAGTSTEVGIGIGARTLAGVGALTGLYDLGTNWEEYGRTPEGRTKAAQRGLQTIGSALTATGVGAGIGVPLTLGATLWDWLT